MPQNPRTWPLVLLACAACASATAATPLDAQGRWLTAEKDAVIEFKPCDDLPTALCGRIVWDKDAGGPGDACGVQIARFARFDDEAWREGWAFDPRDQKKYRAVLRVRNGQIHLRAFVGSEVLGQTERMTRVDALPDRPSCHKG